MNTIRKKREKQKTDGEFQKWKAMMFPTEYDKICFLSMMLIYPSLAVIFLHYLTRILFSLPLLYLVIDPLIFIWWQNRAKKRMLERQRLEEEMSGDRTEIILQKIAELREIEREAAAREAEEAKNPKKKKSWIWH